MTEAYVVNGLQSSLVTADAFAADERYKIREMPAPL